VKLEIETERKFQARFPSTHNSLSIIVFGEEFPARETQMESREEEKQSQ